MQEIISVIIPIHNVSKYLHKCIDSVLNQTYNNLEVILVNDGSTDLSGKICDEYSFKDKRVKVIHKENGGLSDARNAGLRIITGEYIGFVDGDDYIEDDMYETLLETLYDYDADIVQCSYYKVSENKVSKSICSGKIKQFNTTSGLEELIKLMSFSSNVWSKIYKKKLLQGIEFPVNMHCEDLYLNYKVFSRAKKLVSIDVPKYYYLERNEGIRESLVYLENMDGFYIRIERLDFISKKFPSLFNLTQKKFFQRLLKEYKILKDNQYIIDKDKKRRLLIKNYINSNYKSLSSNPLFNWKKKVLLLIFKINFELGYYLFHVSNKLKESTKA